MFLSLFMARGLVLFFEEDGRKRGILPALSLMVKLLIDLARSLLRRNSLRNLFPLSPLFSLLMRANSDPTDGVNLSLPFVPAPSPPCYVLFSVLSYLSPAGQKMSRRRQHLLHRLRFEKNVFFVAMLQDGCNVRCLLRGKKFFSEKCVSNWRGGDRQVFSTPFPTSS